jgi:hypothetical protein
MGKKMLTTEEKAKQLMERIETLTAEEMRYLFRSQRASPLSRKATRLVHFRDRVFAPPLDKADIDYYYNHSLFGESHWEPRLKKAKELLKKPDKMRKLREQLRFRGEHHTRSFLASDPPPLSETSILLFLAGLSERDKQLVKAYEEEPRFQVGSMIQMRANIGVDAIIKKSRWSEHWQSVGRRDLSKLKEKTFMVLNVDGCPDATTYAAVYSYSPTQGGSRLYKVLPIGETKTYYIVEKFMKKCRSKAVKDAKK